MILLISHYTVLHKLDYFSLIFIMVVHFFTNMIQVYSYGIINSVIFKFHYESKSAGSSDQDVQDSSGSLTVLLMRKDFSSIRSRKHIRKSKEKTPKWQNISYGHRKMILLTNSGHQKNRKLKSYPLSSQLPPPLSVVRTRLKVLMKPAPSVSQSVCQSVTQDLGNRSKDFLDFWQKVRPW